MNMPGRFLTRNLLRLGQQSSLPVILLAAVVQGWALYGLHVALRDQAWPASHPAWLLSLYALALFLPATLQLLEHESRQLTAWIMSGAVGAAFCYFGWHHGSNIAQAGIDPVTSLAVPQIAVPLVVLWLLLLPFLECRLQNGHWRAPYRDYFTTAWRNKVLLAEALCFTGLFWLLLVLWAALFRLLHIDFFAELFREPLFLYPVTAIVFGVALYLIGSIDRFVAAVLAQLLGLLKWLGVVATLTLTLFTLALLLRIPELLVTSTRPLAATWLLWLVAVMVLLLNAAYRDGSALQPYPAGISQAVRWATPLLSIVALTALYSVSLRIGDRGLTVPRFWGLIVAVVATLYALGYSAATFRKGPWMQGIGRVNVAVACVLIGVLALSLTPVLSPYRLAANSQYARLLDGQEDAAGEVPGARGMRNDAWWYLRFNAGLYGQRRLAQLAQLEGHPQSAVIREKAREALAATDAGDIKPAPFVLSSLPVFPSGRTLDAGLQAAIGFSNGTPVLPCGNGQQCAGAFVDLNGDGTEEFMLFTRYNALLFRQAGTLWERAATANPIVPGPDWDGLVKALNDGDFGAHPGEYADLRIGAIVYQTAPAPTALNPAPPIKAGTVR